MDARIEALSSLVAVEGMAEVLGRADHVDVTSVVGDMGLRDFLAGFMDYRPTWVRLLCRMRGRRSAGAPLAESGMRPEDIPMAPGSNIKCFTVAGASEDRRWIACVEDRHLCGWLCVLATPEPRRGQRFDVVTVVAYRDLAGSVCFHLMRPLHQLLVGRMVKAGAGRCKAPRVRP